MARPYAYIWQYQVRPESKEQFEQLYGPRGEWVQLFRRTMGYLGTELLRDSETPGRYVTIDHWADRKAYEKFRADYPEEYEAVNRLGEGFTESEGFLGNYEAIGHALFASRSA